MNSSDKKESSGRALLIISIILVACNLRTTITSVGPIVKFIKQSLHIDNVQAGFITTIPLIAFALFSPFVSSFSVRTGNRKAIFIAGLILLAGIFIRFTNSIYIVYLGTLIIGIGIAIMNVVLPALIKVEFPKRIGVMTGIYSTAMCIFAGIASGVSVPLYQKGLSWQWTLAVWGVFSAITMLVWLPQLKLNKKLIRNSVNHNTKTVSVWKLKKAWLISLFMGMQSFMFYCTIAWLPSILNEKGMNNSMAGFMLLIMQIVGVLTSFFLPIIASKLHKMWLTVFFVFIINLGGYTGILFFDSFIPLVSSILLIGLGTGAISMAFYFISVKASDSVEASNLSGMVQSVGYILAATGPVLLGFINQVTNSWSIPIVIILIGNAIFFLAGYYSSLIKVSSDI